MGWASENDRLRKEKKTLQDQVAAAKSEFVKKNVELKDRLRSVENEVKNLKGKISKMNDGHSKFLMNKQNTINKELSLTKEKKKHADQLERERVQKLENMEKEKAELLKKQKDMGDYKGENKKVLQENEALRSNLREVNDKINTVRKEIDAISVDPGADK